MVEKDQLENGNNISVNNGEVAINPTNREQDCIVENGIAQVVNEPVTDVAVSCVEVPVANVSKVAAEGDTLDDTILNEIFLEGSVAINSLGKVAFHGQTISIAAVFTQDGVVVKQGDNLTDGLTTLDQISDTGGVAVNEVGEVAFHGTITGIDAVFMSGINSPPSSASTEEEIFTFITW